MWYPAVVQSNLPMRIVALQAVKVSEMITPLNVAEIDLVP